jgi:predicted transcriptional regulator
MRQGMGFSLACAAPELESDAMKDGNHDQTTLSEIERAELEVLQRAIEEADADAAAGRLVAHERVREWLLAMARGERDAPMPEPGAE